MKTPTYCWLLLVCIITSNQAFRIERQAATEALEVEPAEVPAATGQAGPYQAAPGGRGNAAAQGEVEVETPEWEIPVTTATPAYLGYAPHPMMTTPPFDIISNAGIWSNTAGAFYPDYYQTTSPPFVAAIPTTPGIEPGFSNVQPTVAPPPVRGVVSSLDAVGFLGPGNGPVQGSRAANSAGLITGNIQSPWQEFGPQANVGSIQSASAASPSNNSEQTPSSAAIVTRPTVVTTQKVTTSPIAVIANGHFGQFGVPSSNIMQSNIGGFDTSPSNAVQANYRGNALVGQDNPSSSYDFYSNVLRNGANGPANTVYGQWIQAQGQIPANLPPNIVISGNGASNPASGQNFRFPPNHMFGQAHHQSSNLAQNQAIVIGTSANAPPPHSPEAGHPPINLYGNPVPRRPLVVETPKMLTTVVVANGVAYVPQPNVIPFNNPPNIGSGSSGGGNVNGRTPVSVDVAPTTLSPSPTTVPPSPTTLPPSPTTLPPEIVPTEAIEIEPTEAPEIEPTLPSTTVPPVVTTSSLPASVGGSASNVSLGDPRSGSVPERTFNVVVGPVPENMARPGQSTGTGQVGGTDAGHVFNVIAGSVPGYMARSNQGVVPLSGGHGVPSTAYQNAAGPLASAVAGSVLSVVDGAFPGAVPVFLPRNNNNMAVSASGSGTVSAAATVTGQISVQASNSMFGSGTVSGQVSHTVFSSGTGSRQAINTMSRSNVGPASGQVPNSMSRSGAGTVSGQVPNTAFRNGAGTVSGQVPNTAFRNGAGTVSGWVPSTVSRSGAGTVSGQVPNNAFRNGAGTLSGRVPHTVSRSGASTVFGGQVPNMVYRSQTGTIAGGQVPQAMSRNGAGTVSAQASYAMSRGGTGIAAIHVPIVAPKIGADALSGQVPNTMSRSEAGTVSRQVPNTMSGSEAGTVSRQVSNTVSSSGAGTVSGQVPNVMAGSRAGTVSGQVPNTMPRSRASTVSGQVSNIMSGSGPPVFPEQTSNVVSKSGSNAVLGQAPNAVSQSGTDTVFRQAQNPIPRNGVAVSVQSPNYESRGGPHVVPGHVWGVFSRSGGPSRLTNSPSGNAPSTLNMPGTFQQYVPVLFPGEMGGALPGHAPGGRVGAGRPISGTASGAAGGPRSRSPNRNSADAEQRFVNLPRNGVYSNQGMGTGHTARSGSGPAPRHTAHVAQSLPGEQKPRAKTGQIGDAGQNFAAESTAGGQPGNFVDAGPNFETKHAPWPNRWPTGTMADPARNAEHSLDHRADPGRVIGQVTGGQRFTSSPRQSGMYGYRLGPEGVVFGPVGAMLLRYYN